MQPNKTKETTHWNKNRHCCSSSSLARSLSLPIQMEKPFSTNKQLKYTKYFRIFSSMVVNMRACARSREHPPARSHSRACICTFICLVIRWKYPSTMEYKFKCRSLLLIYSCIQQPIAVLIYCLDRTLELPYTHISMPHNALRCTHTNTHTHTTELISNAQNRVYILHSRAQFNEQQAIWWDRFELKAHNELEFKFTFFFVCVCSSFVTCNFHFLCAQSVSLA